MLRTAIYIDGFNLYFGCLKDTPYRWLDLKKLCENMLQPHNQIITIKYFTASSGKEGWHDGHRQAELN